MFWLSGHPPPCFLRRTGYNMTIHMTSQYDTLIIPLILVATSGDLSASPFRYYREEEY